MPVDSKEINLKELRGKYKLTQEEFADKIGITRELYGQMERGVKSISKASKILIEQFLKENKVPKPEERVDFMFTNSDGHVALAVIKTLADNNSVAVTSIDKAVLSLDKVVQTNASLAEMLKSIVEKVTGGDHAENQPTSESRFEALLAVIADLGAGKVNWKSPQEGAAVLHRRLYVEPLKMKR